MNAFCMNFCVEYSIICYCTFIGDLIIKSCYAVYVESFKGVHHTSFFNCMYDFHNIFHRCNVVLVVNEVFCISIIKVA